MVRLFNYSTIPSTSLPIGCEDLAGAPLHSRPGWAETVVPSHSFESQNAEKLQTKMKASDSTISAREGGERRSQSLSIPLKFRSHLAIADFSFLAMRERAPSTGSLCQARFEKR
jgi:hypothetical protein